MLEEVGVPYELDVVDLRKGEQKSERHLALNPMGKIPILVDGDAIVTESCAIGLYLADRYAPGKLAPALDDPARGAYFRWSVFAPSVIEPCATAKMKGWEISPSTAGWGDYESMMRAMELAIGEGPWLLGDRFSMADVIFGGTVGSMLAFKLIEPRPAFSAYVERCAARPAHAAAERKNAEMREKLGLSG